jgi:hypothetical protein
MVVRQVIRPEIVPLRISNHKLYPAGEEASAGEEMPSRTWRPVAGDRGGGESFVLDLVFALLGGWLEVIRPRLLRHGGSLLNFRALIDRVATNRIREVILGTIVKTVSRRRRQDSEIAEIRHLPTSSSILFLRN